MSGQEPPRKRRRPAVACEHCVRKRKRCNRSLPCDQCLRSGQICHFSASAFTQNANTIWKQATLEGWQHDDGLFPPTSNTCGAGIVVPHALGHDSLEEDLIDPALLFTQEDVGAFGHFTDHGPRQASLTPGTLPSRSSVGHGHWSRFVEKIDIVKRTTETLDNMVSTTDTSLSVLWRQCQETASTARSAVRSQRPFYADLHDAVAALPARTICDKLVHMYFLTYESVYNVLYGSTFMQVYLDFWGNKEGGSERFLQDLLLILAIGTCFHEEPDTDWMSLRLAASGWILCAQTGLARSFEAQQPDIGTLRTSCLLHLARQTDIIPSELGWISADLPLRVAMGLELHKDPAIHFPSMDSVEIEVRRNIWAVVLEFSMRMSFDSAMLPAINNGAFDTTAPSPGAVSTYDYLRSIPLEVRGEIPETAVIVNGLSILAQTARTRLKIAHLLDTLTGRPRHQTVMKLIAELEDEYDTQRASNVSLLNPFQSSTIELIIKSSSAALYRMMIDDAEASQRITSIIEPALQTEMTILQGLSFVTDTHDECQLPSWPLFVKIITRGSGVLKHILWRAAAAVLSELHRASQQAGTPETSFGTRQMATLDSYLGLLSARIAEGDPDFQPYVVFRQIVNHLRYAEDNYGRKPDMEAERRTLQMSLLVCRQNLDRLSEALGGVKADTASSSD